jgi:hypothetical protein
MHNAAQGDGKVRWTGPRDDDYQTPGGSHLKPNLPPERWPYGPLSFHQPCCRLFVDGLFCDCEASDESAE